MATPDKGTFEELTSGSILDSRRKDLKKQLDDGAFKALIDQVNTEYRIGWYNQKPKWDEASLRLKLYNNQKRDKNAVGDPLLFKTFQTLFANLYDDRLAVEHEPRMEGDEMMAENWNAVTEFDYEEMEKAKLDYEWIWDAMFFGQAECLMMEFDRKRTVPVPQIIDPMVAVRSPFAKSARGDSQGRGGLYFYYWEDVISRRELVGNPLYFNLQGLGKGGNGAGKVGTMSQIENNADLRADAQGRDSVAKLVGQMTGDNKLYIVTKGITWYKGSLVYVVLGNNRSKLIRFSKIKGDRMPIAERKLFPSAHQYDGVSVPDLVEDKQRARSVLQNLTLENAKFGAYPTFLYDKNKITNKKDLNREMNKHVAVDGSPRDGIVPVQRAGVGNEVPLIMNILEQAAQSSTATPNQQQGVLDAEKRTATEQALISASADSRFSLSARIFGWSEKDFWKLHHDLYETHFKDGIDEKVVRLKGAFGTKFQKLERKDLIGNAHPDIIVESKAISDAKRQNEMQSFSALVQQISVDPNANVRYAFKKSARLRGLKQDEIDRLLPPTVDELIAREENEKLDANEAVEVNVVDDHQIHLEAHVNAKDTDALRAHIKAHRDAMMVRRENPALDAELPPSAINPNATREDQIITDESAGGAPIS